MCQAVSRGGAHYLKTSRGAARHYEIRVGGKARAGAGREEIACEFAGFPSLIGHSGPEARKITLQRTLVHGRCAP